ncbi:MAG: recombinase RecA [Selenomonadaceae bacterium]|nr:recombinase RecA [Selenomonadaceae bacterium]
MEKKEALAAAMKQIEKSFGKGSIMKLGEAARLDVKAIPTGILPLDVALGIGGLPRGRIIEIYGPEAGGKTTVALHMIASMQAHGGTAAFIDAEHALDPVYAKKLGVDIDELLVAQPDTGEQGLEIADSLISSGAVDIVVVDSVAALVPKAEIEGEMGDAQVGLHARMMSKAMRKLAGVISKTSTIAVFINQIREKVGIMFGNPETTTGGRALKFYSSIRLEVRKGEAIKQGTEVIGNRVKIKVAKNKVAPPFKTAEFDLTYGEGYSRIGGLLDMGVEFEVLTKRGAFIYYNEEKIGQGKENAKKYLEEHPEKIAEIEEKVLASVKKNSVSSEQPVEIVDEVEVEEYVDDEE